MDHPDDAFRHLVRKEIPPLREDCPDANLLAAHIEGRTEGEEAIDVRAHLAVCPECRDVEATLTGHHGAPGAARGPRIHWISLATLAAGGLIAIASLLFLEPDPPEGPGVPASLNQQFLAAALDLASSAPDLQEVIRPLSREERLNPSSQRPVVRAEGPVHPISPRELTLETRPVFRWEAPEEQDSGYAFVLLNSDFEVILEEKVLGTEFPYPADNPPLDRGQRCLWSVSLDEVPSRSPVAFTVADAETAARYRGAVAKIREQAPEPVRDLLVATVALRMGLLDEAYTAIRRAGSAHPDSELARELRRHVRSLLGFSGTDGSSSP